MLQKVKFLPWQRVAFSATFLRSVGWQDAGRRCHMRGTVVNVDCDPLYMIDWGTHQSYVNKHNLVHVDAPGGLNADAEKSPVRGYGGGYEKPGV